MVYEALFDIIYNRLAHRLWSKKAHDIIYLCNQTRLIGSILKSLYNKKQNFFLFFILQLKLTEVTVNKNYRLSNILCLIGLHIYQLPTANRTRQGLINTLKIFFKSSIIYRRVVSLRMREVNSQWKKWAKKVKENYRSKS